MRVKQVLAQKDSEGVVTLAPGTSVADAARLLSERRIGAIIIADDSGDPQGVISERDIVRELGRRGAACMDDTVEMLMTREPIHCGCEDDIHHVLTKMTEGRFRHMPVLEGGRMIGLISIGDVVKARLAELSMERDALESMVMGH